MKKIKVLVIAGAIGFLLICTVTIWASVSAINFVATHATHVFRAPSTQEHLERAKVELTALAGLKSGKCWDHAQSLLTMQPWLERPALKNLAELKVACFNPKPSACQDHNCENIEKFIHTAKGEVI